MSDQGQSNPFRGADLAGVRFGDRAMTGAEMSDSNPLGLTIKGG